MQEITNISECSTATPESVWAALQDLIEKNIK